MKIPVSFELYCRLFHQDIFVIHDTLGAAIDDNISALNPLELKELDSFFETLLGAAEPPVSLTSLVRHNMDSIGFSRTKSVRQFFIRSHEAVKTRLTFLREEKRRQFNR